MRFSLPRFDQNSSASARRRKARPAKSRLPQRMPLEVQSLEPRLALAADDDFIQFVKVGDAGNAADSTGYGAVANAYRIGKYEVTIGQYTQFLNAVAKTDPHGLYNTEMSEPSIAGVSRLGSPGSYTYTVMNNGGDSSNRPITYVSWFDAARFANWMHNGQGTGSTETGAYTLNGATSGLSPARNIGAKFYIPTENEWYKAAYYKGGSTNAGYYAYATQSNSAPGNIVGSNANQANYFTGLGYSVTQTSAFSGNHNYLTDTGAFSGSGSVYGTFDQSGNVFEWNDLTGAAGFSRGVRGGSWIHVVPFFLSSSRRSSDDPSGEYHLVGFRLASPVSAATGNFVVDADGLPLNGVKIDIKRGSSLLKTVYSDYDGNATTLDADGITGDFDLEGIAPPAPGQTTSVVVSAKDLSGKTYTRTINVQASQMSAGKISLGTVKLDGLNTPVGTATSTSTGGAYRTVDPNGVIYLHDDQRSNDNDHVIKRREATSKLAASARYKAEVRAVTTKLAGLGFRENNGTSPGSNAPALVPTSTWATTSSPTGVKLPAAERALLLFQTLWLKQGVSGVLKAAIEGGKRDQVSGQVAAKDLADLNAAKGVIWSLNATRSSPTVVSNYTNDFEYQSNNNRWMHASAIRALSDLDLALDGLTGNLAISVRQLTSNSPATGGDRPGVGGTTHHAGGEIDLPWVTTSGTAGSGNFFRGLKDKDGKDQPVPPDPQFDAKGKKKPPVNMPQRTQEWTLAERTAAINALKPTVKAANPKWTTAQVDAEAARKAEANAYTAGKRWIVEKKYDRDRTKALIQKIFALNAAAPNRVRHLYFNDPALLPGGSSAITPPAGVDFSPIPGHGNHIHFSINFNKVNSLPARSS